MGGLHRHICILILTIACAIPVQAIAQQLKASLITCYPGPEIYELVGHEALRIRGTDEAGLPVDSVWNYGVFDFNTPGFMYRFVKGETDYMVWGYPFSWFMPQYIGRGSKVVEQDLALTPEEIQRLRKLLQINARPENRTYRYNYVRDNCSTRVATMVDSAAAPRRIIYPDSVAFPTFREAMRHYHRNYPWYQFGIDLALGSGIDQPINARQETFAPLRLMEMADKATFADGSPVVSATRIIYSSDKDPVLPATPWYLTPLAVGCMILLISLGVAIWEIRKKRAANWWNTLFFSLLGLTGCVVWFLVFISTHDSTSPNLLSLWLNPLQFAAALLILWRRTRPVAVAMMVVDIILMIGLMIYWPFQAQSTNPAIFPLWGATLILAVAYVIIYPSIDKKDYRHLRT